MIGLDTNVLVRYLTQDDAAQAARASQLIEQELSRSNPGYISLVVVAETAWVLERSYRLSRAALAGTLRLLLQVEVLVVQDQDAVFLALTEVESDEGNLADALISALARHAGYRHTVTFDREALRLPGFAAL